MQWDTFLFFFFRVNSPLNRDLAVNEEFDCPTIDDNKNDSPLKYRNNNDPVSYLQLINFSLY